jgi:hypothetical protein
VVERVVAASVAVANGVATPDVVRATGEPVRAAGRFALDLPPRPVAVVTLVLQQ